MCGDGCDRIVPILHFHEIESHGGYQTVGTALFENHPVARPQDVVVVDLYACYKSHYRVLKHQHEHGCRGTESGKDGAWLTVEQYADSKDYAHAYHKNLECLVYTRQRTFSQQLGFRADNLERRDERAYQSCGYCDDEQQKRFVDDCHGHRMVAEQHWHEHIGEQCREQVCRQVEHAAVEQMVVPCCIGLFREPFDKRKYYLLEQKVCQQTDCGYDAYAKQSVGGG